MTIGTLYGLGVGPGDPELITVKAFRKLQECPVIAYPKKIKVEVNVCASYCRNVHPSE